MDSELVPYYFTGLIVLAILILLVVIASRREKLRVQFQHGLATRLGLQAYDKDRSILPAGLRSLPFVSEGKKRKITNVMQGLRDGVTQCLFDHSFRTGRGKMKREQVQTVACFQKDGVDFPVFSMRPLGREMEGQPQLEFHEIEFQSSHPYFAKGYVVKCSDEAAVRRLFTDEVLDHYTRIRGIAIEANGDTLAFFRPGQQRRPEDLNAFRDNGLKVFHQFQTHAPIAAPLPPPPAEAEGGGHEAGEASPEDQAGNPENPSVEKLPPPPAEEGGDEGASLIDQLDEDVMRS